MQPRRTVRRAELVPANYAASCVSVGPVACFGNYALTVSGSGYGQMLVKAPQPITGSFTIDTSFDGLPVGSYLQRSGVSKFSIYKTPTIASASGCRSYSPHPTDGRPVMYICCERRYVGIGTTSRNPLSILPRADVDLRSAPHHTVPVDYDGPAIREINADNYGSFTMPAL